MPFHLSKYLFVVAEFYVVCKFISLLLDLIELNAVDECANIFLHCTNFSNKSISNFKNTIQTSSSTWVNQIPNTS